MAHPTSFEKKHQQAAKENAKTCNTCHERTFCTDCHAGASVLGAEEKAAERATRSFIHPAPYRSIHALDARTNSNTCSTCHPSSFCSSCHASLGLASLESLRGTGGPHPQEWLDPMSPAFHGREARRSIASCASCHDQGARSVCVRCHQVGGTGGSPHPPGFERRAAPRDNRMCRVCHIR
jgi:membrane protease subunit (stomatin/prohibitin family)